MKNTTLLDIKINNGIGTKQWLSEPMCGNCINYDWTNGDRHKGDCTVRDENDQRLEFSRMILLPSGINALTKCDNCPEFILESNNDKQISIFEL